MHLRYILLNVPVCQLLDNPLFLSLLVFRCPLEFLSLHNPVGKVKPMKSLKISADVFIHRIHIRLEDQVADVSVRADKGIVTDLQTDSPKKTKIRKFLIGTLLSEWT